MYFQILNSPFCNLFRVVSISHNSITLRRNDNIISLELQNVVDNCRKSVCEISVFRRALRCLTRIAETKDQKEPRALTSDRFQHCCRVRTGNSSSPRPARAPSKPYRPRWGQWMVWPAWISNLFARFCRARSRLYQNEIWWNLQENMHLTTLFKLYKMCTLLHRSKLKTN